MAAVADAETETVLAEPSLPRGVKPTAGANDSGALTVPRTETAPPVPILTPVLVNTDPSRYWQQ